MRECKFVIAKVWRSRMFCIAKYTSSSARAIVKKYIPIWNIIKVTRMVIGWAVANAVAVKMIHT